MKKINPIVFIAIAIIGIIAWCGFVLAMQNKHMISDKHVDTVIYHKHDTVYCVTATPYFNFNHRKKTIGGRYTNSKDPKLAQICALPREMLKNYGHPNAPFKFGDTLLVFGDCPYLGEWIVADVGGKSMHNNIDFMVGHNDPLNKWYGVYIKKK